MANLVFEKVNKIYDNGFHAVYDFDLEIKDGEFIVFVGPSGCGKSTMLRTIAGLEEVSKGKIIIDGVLVNTKTPKERGIAMVFQSYALYPHMNVFDNLSFGLVLEGYDEDYIEKRVLETAKILGLEKMLDRFPRQLSGGQCQRVAVGRAIIRKPKVFLMDEPLSNLDAKQRASMRGEIIEIHRKTKATSIYVTHDQIEAMTMADRIVVMRDGYIQQVGSPKELYFRPKNRFVAGFIGEPPMNFIKCTVDKTGVTLKDTDIRIPLDKAFKNTLKEFEGKNLVLGFRPEAVTVSDKADGDSAAFTVTTEVSELLGDSVNVYADLGGHRVILRVSPDNLPKDNIKLKFNIAHQNIFLFDEESQRTLYENT